MRSFHTTALPGKVKIQISCCETYAWITGMFCVPSTLPDCLQLIFQGLPACCVVLQRTIQFVCCVFPCCVDLCVCHNLIDQKNIEVFIHTFSLFTLSFPLSFSVLYFPLFFFHVHLICAFLHFRSFSSSLSLRQFFISSFLYIRFQFSSFCTFSLLSVWTCGEKHRTHEITIKRAAFMLDPRYYVSDSNIGLWMGHPDKICVVPCVAAVKFLDRN